LQVLEHNLIIDPLPKLAEDLPSIWTSVSPLPDEIDFISTLSLEAKPSLCNTVCHCNMIMSLISLFDKFPTISTNLAVSFRSGHQSWKPLPDTSLRHRSCPSNTTSQDKNHLPSKMQPSQRILSFRSSVIEAISRYFSSSSILSIANHFYRSPHQPNFSVNGCILSLIRRIGDPNVLPFIQVTLVFIFHLAHHVRPPKVSKTG